MSNNKNILVLLFIFANIQIFGQAFTGYTLYSPNNSRYTYLIDMNNLTVKTWTHSVSGGYSAYLLEDGSVLRSGNSSNSQLNGGGATGIVQKYDWNGNLIWQYTYSSSTFRSHHDIEPMPNGNVLIIAWEVKTAAQAVAAGLKRSISIWPDHIIEVKPTGSTTGTIVWEWHAWDHLIQDYDVTKANYGVVANHPELLDINVGSTMQGDWMHVNGISYNADLDQIVFSSHNLDEFYVIDHSTTTQEAASHSGGRYGKGGDFLYRWGCPSNYRASGTQVFNVVHSSIWIPENYPGGDNILAFNNREGTNASMIVEIKPPRNEDGSYNYTSGQYLPISPEWTYSASGFYSHHLGGCQRLPNGNTLIVQSTSGKMFEVSQTGSVVWSYNKGGEIVRALRYAPSYPGISVQVSPASTEIFVGETANFTATKGFAPYVWKLEPSDLGTLSVTGTSGIFTANKSGEGRIFITSSTGLDSAIATIKVSEVVGVESGSSYLHSYNLSQNFPNPFNPSTNIQYSLKEESNISIVVYNSLGQLISTLFEGVQSSGVHSLLFNASELPTGIYFCSMKATSILSNETYAKTNKMLLLK
ncbi:MAG TPA: aryl-sulfate sulfotransferase [Melioribacteraceae bacterium]|nr:aryl-sulfate sulfotransferase [Melioribacteraceae bacterium]